MKKSFLFFICIQLSLISCSQFVPESSLLKNIEIYYSPFQSRIGGFEYDINKVNDKSVSYGTSTSANVFKTNDIEAGLNYLFKIKKRDFGVGISYFTDSYKFAFHTALHDKLYRIKRKGFSLNLFYRQEIFLGTTIDIGVNTRWALFGFSNNWDQYSNINVTSSLNVLVDESWSRSFLVEFIPSIQFNTEFYKRFNIRYGIYSKFWGKKFYSVQATEKLNVENKILDFNMNKTTFKATIGIGYSFLR